MGFLDIIRKSRSRLAVLARNHEGSFVLNFAILCIPLVFATGVAVDYARLSSDNKNLQQAADGAAIAAVLPYGATESERAEIAKNYLKSNFEGIFPNTVLSFETVSLDRKYQITANTIIKSSLINVLGIDDVSHSVTSIATTRSANNVCLLALNKTDNNTIEITGSGAHIGTNCNVQSNSGHSSSMSSSSGVPSTANKWCTVGGYSGTDFRPVPETGCDPVDDPYQDMTMPSTMGCDENNFKITNGIVSMEPGTYCGGVKITGGDVTLKPGLYVMKDGGFDVRTANVTGNGVTIYLDGNNAELSLAGSAYLNLSAPKSGAYAGFVFLSDPKSTASNPASKISGTPSSKIVGITYLPKHAVELGGTGAFGLGSPFMSVVADTLRLHGNGKMVFNHDPEAAGFKNLSLPGTRIPYLIQ